MQQRALFLNPSYVVMMLCLSKKENFLFHLNDTWYSRKSAYRTSQNTLKFSLNFLVSIPNEISKIRISVTPYFS